MEKEDQIDRFVSNGEEWDLGPDAWRSKEWQRAQEQAEFLRRSQQPPQIGVVVKVRKRFDDPVGEIKLTDQQDPVFNKKLLALSGIDGITAKHWFTLSAILYGGALCQHILQEQGTPVDDFWVSHRAEIEALGFVFSEAMYTNHPLNFDPSLVEVAKLHFTDPQKTQLVPIVLKATNVSGYPQSYYARMKRFPDWLWKAIGTLWLDSDHVTVPEIGHRWQRFEGFGPLSFESKLKGLQPLTFKQKLQIAGLVFAGSGVSKLLSDDLALNPATFDQKLEQAFETVAAI